MTDNLTIAGPTAKGVGLFPADDPARLINRTGETQVVGNVVQLDFADTAAETVSRDPADGITSVYGSAVKPETAFLKHGVFAIVTGGDLGDNEIMEVKFRGRVAANVDAATAITDVLTCVNAQDELDVGAVAGSKIVGIPEETSGGAALIDIWFNGVEGFGATGV